MKTVSTKITQIVLAILLFSSSSFAQAYLQDPKYGPDEESRKQCAINLSLYREYYNQRNFDMAKSPWQNVINVCPAASQNAYIHGIRMMKTWIEQERNPNVKNQLLDSLALLYDLRIEYFDRRGILLGQKGMDIISLDGDRFEEAFAILKESVEIEKDASDSPVIFTLMAVAKTMYDNNKIDASEVIETYAMLADYLDEQIKSKPEDNRLIQIKENVDALFSSAGVADCNSLLAIFGPRIENNPNDAQLIKKTHALLSANRCENTDFYRNTTIKLFNNEPTAIQAYELAKIFQNLKDISKTEEYYMRAIDLEQDSVRKSKFLVEYAGIMFNEIKRPQQARALALQAIDINPSMGHAYLLIGNIYASEKNCGADDFTKKAVYWAAVDKFIRAKQVDKDLTAEADKLIDVFTQYFPSQSDVFFHDLNPGGRITVGCWINETTTIRVRP